MKKQRATRRGHWVSKHVKGRLIHLKRIGWRKGHIKKQGGLCFYCEKMMREGHHSLAPTLDHYIPLGLGGPDHFENTVAACIKCNHEKGDMCGDDFLELLQVRCQFEERSDEVSASK